MVTRSNRVFFKMGVRVLKAAYGNAKREQGIGKATKASEILIGLSEVPLGVRTAMVS